jgi:hypothetical protein
MVIEFDDIIVQVGNRWRIVLVSGVPLSQVMALFLYRRRISDRFIRDMPPMSIYRLTNSSGLSGYRLTDDQYRVYQTMQAGDLIDIGSVYTDISPYSDIMYCKPYTLYHDGEVVWAYISKHLPISIQALLRSWS